MKSYSELRKAKDLDFEICGLTFTIHMLPLKMIGVWTEREEKIDTGSANAFQQMCIDRVADAVNDGNGASERWRELCESDTGPSYGELLDLARWVWEAQSDLPTSQPAPSAPRRGTGGTSSGAA